MAVICCHCQHSQKLVLARVHPCFGTTTVSTPPQKFARCSLKKTSVPKLTAISYRIRCKPVQSLFGGLFGSKSKQEEPQSKLLLHEDIQLPFPSSLLADTFLAGRELRCCYKASRDGFSATSFHQRCDFAGPCVVVAITITGFRFGAFNPEGYRSTDDYYDTFDAFLFYWESSNDDEKIRVLRKVGGSGAALFDYARGGPQFGADGLLIGPPKAPVMGGFAGPDTNSAGGDLREAKSRLGLSYAVRPDGKDSLFGDTRTATIEEVEVFCCPAIAALY